MNAPANAIAHGLAHGVKTESVARTVDAKRSEVKGPDLTSPDLIFSMASSASWRWVTYRARLADGMMPVGNRRCETCGRFVSKRHLRTARYFYDIDRDLPISVYSLATATRFQERLDCASCSMPCFRMKESKRSHGVAVGKSLPSGWVECGQNDTQSDVCARWSA